jgi:3-oxoacyl-[acyl-carrier protein] reductase
MKDHWRVLNALVNNAGVQGPIGPFCDIDSDAWSEAFKTLLFAPLDMCRMAIPWMASAGGGDIVNLSGGGAAGPRENFTAYSAAKTALVRTTENLAVEYARCGVSVNAVAPGIMPTGLLREVLDAGPDLAGAKDYEAAEKAFENGAGAEARAAECVYALCDQTPPKITGKLISAVWDPWRDLARYAGELASSDVYTLRRVTPESRGKKAGY